MIAFDFDYYRPDSAAEAAALHRDLTSAGHKPLYYAGGTEIVTMARKELVTPTAVIDIKGIPEAQCLEVSGDELICGAAVTLNRITDSAPFPLLAQVSRGVADRTVRNRLTLGGNICGRLPYRETLLPLLLTDARVVLAGPDGIREAAMGELFNKRLLLSSGEFLLQCKIPTALTAAPWHARRREKQNAVDYPLYHLAALRGPEGWRTAFTGVCAFPCRLPAFEDALNRSDLPAAKRIDLALQSLPSPVKEDALASAAYRTDLFRQDLERMLADRERSVV